MKSLFVAFLVASTTPTFARPPAPVIDMHMHAYPADAMGPPPAHVCAPISEWPTWDPRLPPQENFARSLTGCANPLASPLTDDALRDQSIAAMQTHNVYGMLSGTTQMLRAWQRAAPDRFFPGLALNLRTMSASPDTIRSLAAEDQIVALFEITAQYYGIPADSPELDPMFAVAEELDLPVGIHVENGPPGRAYLGGGMRAAYSDPLLLEPVLLKYPRLRLWIAHGAFDQPDRLRSVMHAHPQVHVDIGIHSYIQPEKAFHGWICGLVQSGFGKRLMFGSDQMVWPQTIGIAINRVERTPCLSEEQKRDILYNNAARFLRLDEATIARHHGRPVADAPVSAFHPLRTLAA